MTSPSPPAVVALDAVRVWTAEGAQLLRGVSWTVRRGEHWALIGPNGAGKSTLMSVVSGNRFPSSGTVDIFRGRLGEIEIRKVRRQIGIVDPTLRLHDWMTVREIVLTGATASGRLLAGSYGPPEEAKAEELEALLGLVALRERTIGTCSQGERQRVRLARALMPEPRLLLLDEPASGLDLPAREALLASLSELIAAQPDLTTILVSHHLEELPTATTHAMLLRHGEVVAAGLADDILTNTPLSACFDIPIEVDRRENRWFARAKAAWTPSGSQVGAG